MFGLKPIFLPMYEYRVAGKDCPPDQFTLFEIFFYLAFFFKWCKRVKLVGRGRGHFFLPAWPHGNCASKFFTFKKGGNSGFPIVSPGRGRLIWIPNCKPCLDMRQNPSTDTHFPSYRRRPLPKPKPNLKPSLRNSTSTVLSIQFIPYEVKK